MNGILTQISARRHGLLFFAAEEPNRAKQRSRKHSTERERVKNEEESRGGDTDEMSQRDAEQTVRSTAGDTHRPEDGVSEASTASLQQDDGCFQVARRCIILLRLT